MSSKSDFNRRDFFKLGGIGLGSFALRSWPRRRVNFHSQLQFPLADRLGRVTEETPVNVRTAPSPDAPEAGQLPGDTVVEWLRERVGVPPQGSSNYRWVETPQGYVWSRFLQPVKNISNTPLTTLPDYGNGPGMWAEVTQPYVEAELANATPLGFRVSYLVENYMPIRFYYSEVFWVDDIRQTEAGTQYHFKELHGSRGDTFWAPAEAFRPITPDDVAPISPEIENKKIVVNIARQTMSCYEDEREVFFCRVSTGRYDRAGGPPEGTETPVSDNLSVSRKYLSIHMEGGSAGGGYDLAGIGWASFIATGGVAIHSTYWHNNFGERMSAGCVNASPEDAKFVFRWSAPSVPYYPGKLDEIAGTSVRVIES